ncbi:DUF4184 family protein [Saccharothrix obliqua]|uniref:DUF4184 family protein n=1 Tax=Saccharothrix obliqua TaxID=2861747 RepID=UPI001C5DD050|nr:DUF4184 family protein [Saccharothrix obliqua]MBW4719124.1 DUF4184 family protein [Saccharothrix obliqua]
MPFTVSHIAAALPLARRPLVASALVAGSMAPDIPYFVLLYPGGGEYTHTWWGVFLVDTPIALVALAFYRFFLHEPLLALAPATTRAKLAWQPAPRFTAATAVSAAIGCVTHFVWDAFTHPGDWGVRLVPLLNAEIGPMPGFAWAQWVSTAFGALFALLWGLRRLSTLPTHPVPARFAPPRNHTLTVLALLAFTVAFALVTTTGDTGTDLLVSASITVVSGAVAALALYQATRYLSRSKTGAGSKLPTPSE